MKGKIGKFREETIYGGKKEINAKGEEERSINNGKDVQKGLKESNHLFA